MAAEHNALALIQRHGVSRFLFVTLTFDEPVSNAVARKRLKSLRTGVLDRHSSAWIWVRGRTKRGRIHYHVLIATFFDVRSGFDFRERKSLCPQSGNAFFRSEWVHWQKWAASYGFGIVQLAPIHSAQAIAHYLAAHLLWRTSADKGSRFIGCSAGVRVHTAKFSLVNERSRAFRRMAAQLFGDMSIDEVRARYGRYWAMLVFRRVVLERQESRYHDSK